MTSVSKPRVRDRILEVLAARPTIPMTELAEQIYGGSTKACIDRIKVQISTLRKDGYGIHFDDEDRTLRLLRRKTP